MKAHRQRLSRNKKTSKQWTMYWKLFLEKYDIPGASLAVSKNEKLVYAKGYGYADTEAGEKVTPDHQFRLASVSKTYTAVAIMSLVQDGKLSLSDHIFGDNGILGDLYGTPPYNSNLRSITVADLLLNTSGSWGGATGGDVIDHHPNYTNDQFLDWVLDTRPNPKAPGTVYDYSNVGFWLAGRVIPTLISLVVGGRVLYYVLLDYLFLNNGIPMEHFALKSMNLNLFYMMLLIAFLIVSIVVFLRIKKRRHMTLTN